MTADSPQEDLSMLLLAWSNGDETALEKLVPLVYEELHHLAHQYINRERPGNTLQTTALVHEAYLRLGKVQGVRWQNRTHFFAVAATVMRHILVDFARSRRNLKRGGGARKVSLDGLPAASTECGVDLLALDEALQKLSALNPRQAKVVELRYFGGLTEQQIAQVMSVSPRTVRSDWSLARVWLYRELTSGVEVDA